MSIVDQPLLEMVTTTARAIWLRTNKLIHEGTILHLQILFDQAELTYEDYQMVVVTRARSGSTIPVIVVRGEPPMLEWCKVNWDVTVHEDYAKIGIGVVFRDYQGDVLAKKKGNL